MRVASREAGANAPQLLVTVNAPAPPPPTPPSVQATASAPGRIEVAWTVATSSNGIDFYVVERNDAHLATLNGDLLGYTDTAVAPDTTYKYSVVAVNFNGLSSEPSNEATVTTLPTPPPTLQLYLPLIDK
jgi:chitin-binding protein